MLRVDAENVRDQWLKILTKAGVDFITTKKKIEKEKQEQCKTLYNPFAFNLPTIPHAYTHHTYTYLHISSWTADMRTMQKSVGWMDVTVVKGVDLLAKDPNGKSDPFCVIRLGDQQEQTTPVIQGSLNPKWNFTVCVYTLCVGVN